METELIVTVVLRWIHIASAMVAIGGAFFVRFGLLPAASKVLDDATHQKLRAAVNARWKHVVWAAITLLILTGLYNFLVTARWKDFGAADKQLYQMLIGIKMTAALGIFFLASALVGRTATLAVLRKNAKASLTVLLVLAGVLLVCSSVLRYLPRQPAAMTNLRQVGGAGTYGNP